MKPHIKRYRHTKMSGITLVKWRCASEEPGNWGPYTREGTGYTPAEAYAKWLRYGGFNRRRAA
jgi:hypothetical protein